MTHASLSVILPLYNEASLLEEAVAALRTFLTDHFADWEIIIVESGSTDSSADLANRLALADSRVRVLHEGGRNGFGSALRLGIAAARKDLVLMTTADQPFPLDAVLRALPFLSTCDCILSYRDLDARKSWFRRFQSVAYNALVRWALGIRTRHVNSAFKLYRRTLIQSLPLQSCGWFIDAEIVYWLTRRRTPYAEIPVPLLERTRGQSSVTLATAFGLVRELAWFLRQRGRRDRITPTRDDGGGLRHGDHSGGEAERGPDAGQSRERPE